MNVTLYVGNRNVKFIAHIIQEKVYRLFYLLEEFSTE